MDFGRQLRQRQRGAHAAHRQPAGARVSDAGQDSCRQGRTGFTVGIGPGIESRGAAMAKQLMEEEKMARRIKKELPKLTILLEEKLEEWKETHNEDFLYHGEIYAETMSKQNDEWMEYKQNELQLKLKKKQEDQVMEENKYPGLLGHGKKKNPSRPLGDGSRLHNITNTTTETRARNTSDQKVLRTAHIGPSRVRTLNSLGRSED